MEQRRPRVRYGRMRDELLNEALFFVLRSSSMRAVLSRNGRKTTTRADRIRRSATRHRWPLPQTSLQQAITLRSLVAPRAGLLLTPPERA